MKAMLDPKRAMPKNPPKPPVVEVLHHGLPADRKGATGGLAPQGNV